MRALIVLVPLTIAFYWKLALTDQYVWFDHPDMAYLEIPRLEFMAREVHAGRFPLWDPHIWMGQPLVGQTQPGPVNPLNILFVMLPLRDGYLRLEFLNWYYVLLHAIAALGAYALCRELRRSRPASILAACVFSFGGFVGSVAWLDVLSGAVWTPFAGLFFLRAARGRRPLGNAALAGLFLGLAWLSGHHEIPLLASLGVLLAWITLILRRGTTCLPLAAITLAITALVGAAQLWPTIEFGRLSHRWGPAGPGPVTWRDTVPYLSAEIYSLTPRGMAGLLLPDQGTIGDSSGFMGLSAGVLAIAGLLSCWRSPAVRWLAAMAGLSLAYAMGAFTPLHGVLYAVVPELHRARVPVRALHLANLALAILTAYGADSILGRRGGRWTALVALATGILGVALVLAGAITKLELGDATLLSAWAGLLFCVLVLAWRAKRISQGAFVAAIGFLMLTELHAVHTRAWRNRHSESGQPFARQLVENRDVADFLRSQPAPVRVVVNDRDVPVNFGDLHSIDMAEGYVAGVTSNLLRFGRHTPWAQRLYAVTHYIGREPNRPDLVELFRGQSGVGVFRLPDSLPRARAVHEARTLPDAEALALAMQKADFDPARVVLLAGEAPELERCEGSKVTILAYAPNRVRLRAEMPCRGMVVLSDTYYPGWRAYVDGRRARIWEAYGAVRGVVVEAGSHEVDFRFRPASVFGGAALTALGLLMVALLNIPRRSPPAMAGTVAARAATLLGNGRGE